MSFDLEKFDQWITWDYENGNKIPKKINGGNAKSNDPATWSRYADVHHLERKAFVFSADDPFFGIDLDDAISAQGVLTPEASEIVQQFRNKALIEVSPSLPALANELKVQRTRSPPAPRHHPQTAFYVSLHPQAP